MADGESGTKSIHFVAALQDAIFGGQIFDPRQQPWSTIPATKARMRAQSIRPPRQPIRNCLPKNRSCGTRRGYTGNGQLTVFSTVPIF
jgi:hypothetical protein